MYLMTHRSTHNASPGEKVESLKEVTHFLQHMSDILKYMFCTALASAITFSNSAFGFIRLRESAKGKTKCGYIRGKRGAPKQKRMQTSKCRKPMSFYSQYWKTTKCNAATERIRQRQNENRRNAENGRNNNNAFRHQPKSVNTRANSTASCGAPAIHVI